MWNHETSTTNTTCISNYLKKKLRERERDESYVSQSVLTLVIH